MSASASAASRPRVLVVDDSAFARRVVREVLLEDARIDVVGYARDGLDALEQITTLAPDVVTLDMMMPELDGLGVLEVALRAPSPPRFILVTTIGGSSDLVLKALELGAFDFVHKPTSLATDRLYGLRDELVRKVLAAHRTPVGAATPPSAATSARTGLSLASPPEIVVIGASTGGPRAITELVSALPKGFALPLAIVLHMPPGYLEAYAERLDRRASVTVACATDGAALPRGCALIAPAGTHLEVHRCEGRIVARLTPNDGQLHVPSVDALFLSAARAFGARALGIVLTGMGDDGALGSKALRTAGGAVWTESEASAVVYGMPRAVVAAGASSAAGALDEFAPALSAISGALER